jgi:hypothetical protein
VSMRRPVHRTAPMAAVSLVLASLLVACGSGDDGASPEAAPSPTSTWADDLCTSIGEWRQTMAEARASLSDPKELSVADIEAIGRQMADATTAVVADLQDPDIDTDEIHQKAAELADQLERQAQVVQDALQAPGGTAAELLGQVSAVTGAVATMVADTKAAVASLDESASGAALDDELASSPACKELGVG